MGIHAIKQKFNPEMARRLFLEGSLWESYHIFRRFFDHISFEVLPEHHNYMAPFAYLLVELKKGRELEFYANRIQNYLNQKKTPELAYLLGSVFAFGFSDRFTRATPLFEFAVKHADSKTLRNKSRVSLAYCYDKMQLGVSHCEKVIDTIEEAQNSQTNDSVRIWKAKILKDQRRYKEFEKLVSQILLNLSPQDNWYTYFTTKVLLIEFLLEMDREEEGQAHILGLRKEIPLMKLKRSKGILDKLELKIKKVVPPTEMHRLL